MIVNRHDDHPDERIDRSEETANVSVDWDRTAPDDDDGRSGMRTKFHASEASDEQKFGRLWSRHSTRQSKQAEREAQRRRDAATWCNALDMTDYQRDRVLYLVDRVSFDEPLDGYGLGSLRGILAIIVHVAAEDGRELIELIAVAGVEGPKQRSPTTSSETSWSMSTPTPVK
jgi:hypothetical protein